MPITKEDILRSLRDDMRQQVLTTDDWRRTVEQYPYCEIFVWHYLRALYRADDISFDNELQRLAIHICDKQAFYNFMVRKAVSNLGLDYNTVSTDYFAQREVGNISLTDLARKLRAARVAGTGAETTFCTGGGQKNDIAEGSDGAVNGCQMAENAPKSEKKEETEASEGSGGVREANQDTSDNQRDIRKEIALLMKQKKYSEALAILKRENFANSKKNAYFAVQIKYIETIINSK